MRCVAISLLSLELFQNKPQTWVNEPTNTKYFSVSQILDAGPERKSVGGQEFDNARAGRWTNQYAG